MGTYCYLSLSMQHHNVFNSLLNEINTSLIFGDLHCGLFCDNNKYINVDRNTKIQTSIISVETWFVNEKKYLVVILDKKINQLHESVIKEFSVTHNFKKYIPHITLSYDVQDICIKTIRNRLCGKKIVLNKIVSKKNNENWLKEL
jgi:hypothetical protein